MELFDYEKKHIGILRETLAECTLFLKRDGQFPITAPGKIAAYGNGIRHTVKGGTGSGEVNSRYSVSVEEALKTAGFTIATSTWLDSYDKVLEKANKEFVKSIKALAKKKHTMAAMEGMGVIMPEPEYHLPLDGDGDLAVYVLSRISGEGGDRNPVAGDILISETEKRDILRLQEKYAKFLLVLNVGGVVDLSGLENVKNILLLSQLGVETGCALTDIILGKTNPSGKLTTTWAAWKDYCSIGEFGDMNDTRYNEGIYVGYRYFNTIDKKPLFPFGFGLSYTDFDFSVMAVTSKNDNIKIHANVTNTGRYSGKEVLQVYVSAPLGKLDKPYQELAGWSKTSALAPGASQELTLSFSLSDMASYDEDREAFVLEKGNYVVRVGNSSEKTEPVAVIKLADDVVTLKTRNCLGKPDFQEWKPDCKSDIPAEPKYTIQLSASDFTIREVVYDHAKEIDDTVRSLSDEELVYTVVGGFNPKGGAGVIGTGSTLVAGGAGETTRLLTKKGIPTLVMADGPAGLRLAQKFYRDESGAHAVGNSAIPASFLPYIPWPVRILMRLLGASSKPKKGQKLEYQYATAIPVGTAIAQSFNEELVEKYGDIVGDEMERFGVHLWLAPALNIHRSIRCGRNFEYYSEDPVVSGKIAAAITRGVQKHPGCGTTIKHYAANNQEKNRYASNSILSERAMREIYLKGFGICIKESSPHALMTSYNLLNGIHTSEHPGLMNDILRSEFEYKGIVMTDWLIAMSNDKASLHRPAIASEIMKAGGDLIMPGCKADYDDIRNALKNGTLSKEQLQINATHVYQKAKELCYSKGISQKNI